MAGPVLALLATLAACADAQPEPGRANAANAKPVVVRTVTVRAQPLERELLAVGSLRSGESVTVRPEVAGRVTAIGFAEGEAVKRGQVLFELDSSIDRAQLDRARASQVLAQRSAQRADELHGRGLISAAERDQATANLALAAAELAVAQAQLDKMRILAPFAGVAGLRSVSPGDYVVAGQDLAGLEALDTMKIDFRVDQSHLPALHAGQTIGIRVDAFPGEHFAGEVYAIDPRVAEATRSIALRARVPNAEGRLRPGQFAQIRLVLARIDDALVVPERALFPRGSQQFVYVVDEGRAQLREVGIGQRVDGHVHIVDGLDAGEQLIVSGIQQISDGVPVAATPAE